MFVNNVTDIFSNRACVRYMPSQNSSV